MPDIFPTSDEIKSWVFDSKFGADIESIVRFAVDWERKRLNGEKEIEMIKDEKGNKKIDFYIGDAIPTQRNLKKKPSKCYVCGFVYFNDLVSLIRKNKPGWQKGKLNGLGGKIEDGEIPEVAMQREFQEEAGLLIPLEDWELCVVIENVKMDYMLYIFRAFSKEAHNIKTMESEEVQLRSSVNIPEDTLPNLKWLIPMTKSNDLSFPIYVTDIGDK